MDKHQRFRATNLKLTMDQQGRRGDWLARQLGCSPSYVCRVMKGQRFMDRDDAARVAEILGVPFSLLFVLSSDMSMETTDDVVSNSLEGKAA